jgi:hypothetical protein
LLTVESIATDNNPISRSDISGNAIEEDVEIEEDTSLLLLTVSLRESRGSKLCNNEDVNSSSLNWNGCAEGAKVKIRRMSPIDLSTLISSECLDLIELFNHLESINDGPTRNPNLSSLLEEGIYVVAEEVEIEGLNTLLRRKNESRKAINHEGRLDIAATPWYVSQSPYFIALKRGPLINTIETRAGAAAARSVAREVDKRSSSRTTSRCVRLTSKSFTMSSA